MSNTFYCTKKWLNPEDSPSLGSVSCYDGMWKAHDDTEQRNLFIAITDCYVTAKLHKTHEDSVQDFIEKLKLLRNEIDSFINYLEKSENHGNT